MASLDVENNIINALPVMNILILDYIQITTRKHLSIVRIVVQEWFSHRKARTQMRDYIIAIILIPVYILLALLGRRFLKFAHGYEKGLEDAEKIRKLEENRLLDEIRAEIIKYEGDCRLSVDEYPSCKQCTDSVFESIYAILDKCKAESEK